MSLSSLSQSRTQPIPKITIIFMSENHTDPAPVGMTRQYMRKFHAQGIRQIGCAEVPSDFTIQKFDDFIQAIIKLNNKLLELESIQSIAVRSPHLAFPYFPRDLDDKISAIFFEKFPEASFKFYQDSIEHLYRHLNTQETSLSNEQHLELNIPFQGIEKPMNEHIEMAKKIAENPKLLYEYETKRINEMTKNIFDNALVEIADTGGILWVKPGYDHSLNLATSVYNHILENQLHAKYSFQLIPTVCFSPYAQKINCPFDFESISLASKNYLKNEKLISLSQKIPLHFIEIKETGPHRYASSEFDDLMKEVERNHLLAKPKL